MREPDLASSSLLLGTKRRTSSSGSAVFCSASKAAIAGPTNALFLPDKGSHAIRRRRQMPAPIRRQGSRRWIQETPYSPAGGVELGRAGGRRADPVRTLIYRLIWRPALAEIVGDGRPCTVPMISLLSMPCR